MSYFEIIVLLVSICTLLVAIAQRLQIPYPLVLVLGGVVIGFLPDTQPFFFEPHLTLVIVLPPILYYGAYQLPLREVMQHWKEISSLSFGLVIATTVIVAIVIKWLQPEFSWALAFAVGAIVSPPDAVAAMAVLKRFAIHHRTLTILEGESLLNDASALVLYRLALVAILSGTFSFLEAVGLFFEICIGGIAVGIIAGFVMQHFSRRYLDAVVGVLFSFTIPYTTYIIADSLGFSGVLAVVVSGLIGARIQMTNPSPQRRLFGLAVWDVFIIVLNCLVFVLIGTQLGVVTDNMSYSQLAEYCMNGAVLTAVMITIRLVWVYSKGAVNLFHWRSLHQDTKAHAQQLLREATIVGWSGMRGIVSLVAALGLPFTLPNGEPLTGRHEAVYIIFVVIMLTLLIPALTLPKLLAYLKVRHLPDMASASKIRALLVLAAEQEINHLFQEKAIDEDQVSFLNTYFKARHRVLDSSCMLNEAYSLELARIKVIGAQRRKLIELWRNGDVDDRLIRRLERELDVEESHAARAEIT